MREVVWDADEWVFIDFGNNIQLYHRCDYEEFAFKVGGNCLNCGEPVPCDIHLERSTIGGEPSILYEDDSDRPPYKLQV